MGRLAMSNPPATLPPSVASPARLIGVTTLLAAYKIVFLGMVLVLAHLRPDAFSLGGYLANFRWPPAKMPGPAEWLTTWDGEQYLYLSEHGYEAGSPTAGLYPLWPWLVRGVSFLTGGHAVLAAVVSANLLSLIAWGLLFRLVADSQGDAVATRALLLLVAFPGALFYQFAYSESLFLFLAALLFTGMGRGRYLLVGLAAFLLALTRAVGVLCVLPLLWWAWERRGAWLVCASPILGCATYLGFMHASTGNAFEGFAAQASYVHQQSTARLLDVAGFFRSFFTVAWGHGLTDSPIDRVFFVLFVVSLPRVWRMSRVWFFYALGLGLVPAITAEFASYTRFLAVCFPVFAAFAAMSRHRRIPATVFAGSIALLWLVQLALLLRHVTFRWAG